MAEAEAMNRYDERDNVQGRLELAPETPAWKEYYNKHQNLKETDLENQRLHRIPVGHPADNLAAEAARLVMRNLGREDIVDGPVAPTRIDITPERAAEKIRGWAEYLGIDIVRIGPLDPAYVYSHKGRTYGREGESGEPKVGTPINLTHKHAIVLVKGLEKELLKGAPKKQVMFTIFRAYSQLANTAVTLANYIRMMGYPARAHILTNYQVIVSPIAVDAGVGEFGRSGIVISREFGQAMKMAVVTTDMPIVYDQRNNFKVENICRNCRICAENCPAGAINHGDKKSIRGAERYPFNAEACFKVWKTTGTDCGVCIISCPFSRDPSLCRSADVNQLSPADGLTEELSEKIERMRSESHDPDARLHYDWIEEQPQVWKKYRYGKVKTEKERQAR